MAQNDELLMPWSSGLWVDLGMPSNTTPSTISGYAVQSSAIGRLNDLIGSCFSGSGYTGAGSTVYQIGPFITPSELAIIGQLYLVSFYNNAAMATMGVGGSTIPFQTLREGDSTITRVNAASIGSQYREMSKEANIQLQYLVNAYRGNSAGANLARSIDFFNPSYCWGGNSNTSYTGPA